MTKLRAAILLIALFTFTGGQKPGDAFYTTKTDIYGSTLVKLNEYVWYHTDRDNFHFVKGYVKLSRAERDSIVIDAKFKLNRYENNNRN